MSVEVKVTGFVDADFPGDVTTERSQSGYVFQHCGEPINWVSNIQAIVALSAIEAEYVAAAFVTQELLWLRKLLHELGFVQHSASVLLADNKALSKYHRNPKFHCRLKHMDMRHHFLHDAVEAGTLLFKYCETGDWIADIMMKGLMLRSFHEFTTGEKAFHSCRELVNS